MQEFRQHTNSLDKIIENFHVKTFFRQVFDLDSTGFGKKYLLLYLHFANLLSYLSAEVSSALALKID
jgi:hypothetical protein